jgi:hypothetical protein
MSYKAIKELEKLNKKSQGGSRKIHIPHTRVLLSSI